MAPENQHQRDPAGYVDVIDDPLHKEVYADGYFRAYIATIEPGQATGYHRHCEDTVYIVINGGRMGNTNFNGYKRSPMVFPRSFPLYKKLWFAVQNVFAGSVHLPDGLFFFMPTKKHPAIHLATASARNRETVRLLGIEMRYSSVEPTPLVDHSTLPLRVEYDNGALRALECALGPEASGRISMPGHHLFIVCTKGLLNIAPEPTPNENGVRHHLATGDYLCISGDSPAMTQNPGNVASQLIILAIPRDAEG
jgi:hypothetical protein